MECLRTSTPNLGISCRSSRRALPRFNGHHAFSHRSLSRLIFSLSCSDFPLSTTRASFSLDARWAADLRSMNIASASERQMGQDSLEQYNRKAGGQPIASDRWSSPLEGSTRIVGHDRTVRWRKRSKPQSRGLPTSRIICQDKTPEAERQETYGVWRRKEKRQRRCPPHF